MELAKNLQDYGMTILMISHNMDDLAEHADRILVLNQARLYMNGTPQEVFGEYEKLIAAGLDLPEAAKLAIELKKRGWEVPGNLIRYDQIRDFLLEKLGGRND